MLHLKELLKDINRLEASDLYLSLDAPPSFRVHGKVQTVGDTKVTSAILESIAKEILEPEAYKVFLSTNEYNTALHYEEIGRFRTNLYRQKGNISIVIREIRTHIQSIDNLELPNIIKEISMMKRGLVLVVGATGSGKSTTIAAMIDHRNTNESGHIITIEDPIEFIHQHKQSIISQREIGIDTESYHVALKNALRQAPDVVLIGEIRDQETMEAAVTFAETGHLCLATLHSNNANQTLERILSFYPPEKHRQIYHLLSLNLKGIISQRLVSAIDNKRRVASMEILLDSPRVKDLISKGETAELKHAMEQGTVIGMRTFDDHLFELYKGNKITLEEALRNADSVNNLRLKIKLTQDEIVEPNKCFK
ncbi:MAG: PilT/PilU family type 4a pilus ATPase [Proteobacteria bacterium]|nr:PilT/PilU family type 4a pilus ATPase [Pseudomonadota bacterium]